MKRIFISSIIAPLSVSLALGQVVETGSGTKLGRYHSALLKSPESKILFQRFQTGWLAQGSEESLEGFLKAAAGKGSVADKQLYAYFLLQKGEEKEAVDVLTSAIVVDKKNAQVLLDRANAYARLLDFDRAVIDVNAALKIGGDDRFTLTANKQKGRFLARQGKADDAAAHWKELAKKNPKDQELIEDVIDILITDRLSPLALELAVQLRDNTKDPYKKALRTLRVGDILFKLGERGKALETYVNTLDLSGAGSWLEREIVGQIETIFKKEDNLNGLAKEFTVLVKKYPQRVHIENKLAVILVELERFDEAKKVYRGLLKKSPLDNDLRIAYFRMLKNAGDLKAARGLIDSMITHKPEDAQLHLQRASLSYALGAKEEVLVDLANFKKFAKANAMNALKYSAQLNQYGFEKEAIVSYKNVVVEYPSSSDSAMAVADFLFSKKQKDEAVKIWSDLALRVDRDALIRLLDTLILNAQGDLAMDIVESNYDKYKTNLFFLASAIRVADSVKNVDLALKYANTQLTLAKRPIEIQAALNKVSSLIVRSNKVSENIKRLDSKGDLSDSEKFLLADLEDISGAFVKSETRLLELSESESPVNLLQLVRVYERRGQFEKAVACLEKLIKIPDELKAIHLRSLSQMYLKAGNIKQALATVERWKTLSPNDKNAWLAMVELLVSINDHEAALATLIKGAQKFEGDIEMLTKLGFMNTLLKRHSQASLVYWRLYDESDGVNDRIRWASELAKSAQKQGAMEGLVDEMVRRRRNSPKSLSPILALAEVYGLNNQLEERRNLLLEASRLRPDDPFLMLQVASMDIRNGASVDAINILRKARKLDKTGKAAEILASLLMSEGNFEEALDELENVGGKSDPRMAEGYVAMLIQQSDYDKANTYLKKILVDYPDDWRLLLLKNIILYEQGFIKDSAIGALNLLSKNNKMENISSGWDVASSNRSKYFLMIDGVMPAKYYDLWLLERTSFYLNGLARIQHMNSYAGRLGEIIKLKSWLPKNIKSMHLMANSLFFKALDDLPENEQKDLLLLAKNSGVDDPQMLLELYCLRVADPRSIHKARIDFFIKKIKKSSENKNYYNFLVVSKMIARDFILPKLIFDKAKELNMGDNDIYIRDCLAMFTAADLTQEERTGQILAMIQKDGKIEDREVYLLYISHIKMIKRGVKKEDFDPKVITILNTYYQKYKNEKTPDIGLIQKNYEEWHLMVFLNRLFKDDFLNSGNYKVIIYEIESKNDSSTKKHYVAPINNIKYGVGRLFGGYRKPLTDMLTSVSLGQLWYFDDFKKRINKAKLKANLNFFKNPILKIIATNYSDSEANVMPILEEAKKDLNIKSDAHILHAKLLEEANKPMSEVLVQLDSARKSSFNRVQRIKINATVMNIGLKMDEASFKKLNDSDKEIIRTAARRLITSREITESKIILEIIKKFSMEREQARFLNKNNLLEVQKLASQKNTVVKFTGNSRSQDQLDSVMVKLQKAVSLNQKERAVNIAYQNIREILKRSEKDPLKFVKYIKEVNEFNLAKAIMSKMDPQDSRSARKWIQYYELGKILGDKKAKVKAISNLSVISVIPKEFRISAALAIYNIEREKALKLLRSAPVGVNEVMIRLYLDLKKKSKTPEAYISSLDFINSYIASFGAQACDALSNSDEIRLIFMDCIRIREAKNDNMNFSYVAIDKNNIELIDSRDKACEQFIHLAMQCHKVADIAFKIYLKGVDEVDKYSDANIEIAKNSIVATAKMMTPSGFIKWSQYSYDDYRRYVDIHAKLADRLNYLSQAVIFKKDSSFLDDDFLEVLKPLNAKLHRKLKGYRIFILASKVMVLKEMEAIETNSDIAEFTYWLEILDVHTDKKLKVYLAGYFFKYLKTTSLKEHNLSSLKAKQERERLISYTFLHLYENQKQKYLIDFVDSEMKKLLKGQEKSRLSVWEKIDSDLRYPKGGMDGLVINTVMKEMMRNPISIVDGIKLVEKYEYYTYGSDTYGSVTSGPDTTHIITDQYEKLRDSGYLNNPEKMTLTKMPFFVIDFTHDRANQISKKKNPKRLSKYKRLPKIGGFGMSYDVQCLARIQKEFGSNSRNAKTRILLENRLRYAPTKYQYGASLFLTLMDKKTFASFVKDNLEILKRAPKEHLKAIHEMFDLGSNVKHQAVLKSNKLEDLFAVGRGVKFKKE